VSRPATDDPTVTRYPPDGAVRAVVLLLPGGKATSDAPTAARQLTVARMVPFARSLHRGGRAAGLAVHLLRYRVRGWNGTAAAPVADARWALRAIRQAHGDVPVVLVGHSMGGRTAVRLGGDANVAGVVALAPWLPDDEPVEQLAGASLLVLHGSLDFVTSAAASRRFVQRVRPVARRAAWVAIQGDSHAMLLRPHRWHALTRDATLSMLGLALTSRRIAAAFGEEPGQLLDLGGRGKNPEVRST
jgi:pimeloyl-ACP methyl ester carboxylesterase